MKPIEILLLSQADLIQLDLSPDDVLGAVEQAMREHAAGTYEMHPKIGVHPTGTAPDNFIHAMPAYLKQLGACGLKWVGGFSKNPSVGLPNITGIQVCNDVDTGIPQAVMDCAYLTGLRTAAVSAVIARRCAPAGATELALLGCGFQGGMHLRFFLHVLPGIRRVRLYDVRPGAAADLAARTRQDTGFSGELVPCDSPRSALEGAHVISTCTNGDDQIIRPEWFQEGAFGVGIEGGCAYTAEALHQAEKFIVDDIPLAEYFQKISIGRKNDRGEDNEEFPGGLPPVYATIGEIVSGQKSARDSEAERIIAIPIGMAICDIALGHVTLARAREKGFGHTFRLS
jgi:ornithine cyclodeaminase/alanine dehydrogenase-like protein (mu-crystallin family)